MKVKLLMVGKTKENFVEAGCLNYRKRIVHYLPYEEQVIAGLKNTKNMASAEIKLREGELILKHLQQGDTVVLLDEKGREFTSEGFAGFIGKLMNTGTRQLVFVIGGAYGFSPQVYARADHLLSLSKMTFSHQIIRLIFAEQFYRAMTILNNEPYHNA
jgi:23S rRNA (pseudouridine1915-N3)-methyltransferase